MQSGLRGQVLAKMKERKGAKSSAVCKSSAEWSELRGAYQTEGIGRRKGGRKGLGGEKWCIFTQGNKLVAFQSLSWKSKRASAWLTAM